jgi:hypothetical protein
MSFGKRGVAVQASGRASTVTRPPISAVSKPQQASDAGEDLPNWAASKLSDKLKAWVFVALMAAFLGWFAGVDLWRDVRLASTYRAAADIEAKDGSCKNALYLMSMCDVTLVARGADGRTRKIGSYQLYGPGSMGGVAIVPVRSTVDPDAITHQAAIDHLTGRIITFLLLFGLMAMMTVSFTRDLLAGRYIGGRAWVERFGPVPA